MSTQVASVRSVPRPPAMCGSDTLAMLVSRISMNVAIVTTMATTQGLTLGLAQRSATTGGGGDQWWRRRCS